jgi:hypothetical protein
MKDIVENRNRITLTSKMRLALIAVRENGLPYLAYLGISYLGDSLSNFGFRRSDELRRAKNLPGMNSRAANRYIWDNWDWSAQGDEWTPSDTWKRSVVKNFIDRYFRGVESIIEIGPGAGRWTEYLVTGTKRLVGIDISQTCVDECRKRFATSPNASFELGNGIDLQSTATASVDRIWSFDVFVHINRAEFASYVSDFARVLRDGGMGAIHHGSFGGSGGGWRSNVTIADVREMMSRNSLEIISQVQSWTDGRDEHQAGLYGDTITVFRKSH